MHNKQLTTADDKKPWCTDSSGSSDHSDSDDEDFELDKDPLTAARRLTRPSRWAIKARTGPAKKAGIQYVQGRPFNGRFKRTLNYKKCLLEDHSTLHDSTVTRRLKDGQETGSEHKGMQLRRECFHQPY